MKLNPEFFRSVVRGFGDAAKVLFALAVFCAFGGIAIGALRELWLAFPEGMLLLIAIVAVAVIVTFAISAIGAWFDGHRPFKDR